jgi:hypothetical protein
MRSHRRIGRPAHALALGLAAIATLAPAYAAAQPIDQRAATAQERYYASYGASAVKAGDTPVDDPGASRTPRYDAPSSVRIVQPERTVVRDVDGRALPIVLAAVALLVASGGTALVLIRTRAGTRHSLR